MRVRDQIAHDYKQRRYHYSDAIELSFDYVNGQTYLITQPDISIRQQPGAAPLTKPEIKALKRDILWRQRNAEYMIAVKNWRRRLFEEPGWRVVYPAGAETGFEFVVGSPICTRKHSSRPAVGDPTLAGRFVKYERFKAFTVEEPFLRFAGQSRQGKPVKSIHPIRGLIECGGPLEGYQESLHSSRNIRVGVVCLASHERLLGDFLQALNQPARVGKYDDADYVVDFPGFEAAFRCGLSIPSPNDSATWKTIQDINDNDPFTANRKATEAIADCIRQIEAAGTADVVIIYVPAKWARFERIVTETVYLDLHDQVKAFCVQKHVRSQLIREAKVRNEKSARIRWWLSLALFTKALRVPWMLDATDEKVAYAGIGFAVDSTRKDHRIVIGCSHLFNAAGVGMKFRLSELRDPIWKWEPTTRRKNPFMSRDDAYQLGVRTRQLFFEAHHETPERVVLCKRTPFLETEIEGLLGSFSGIKHVDLLTVEYEDAWRFCAYDPGKAQPHGFPVKRGTGLILDSRSLLLWLHGNVLGVKEPARSYFQGKSRIPVPVRMTRYSGDSPVETLARDMVSLTKMDWNTFALYKKLPVTVTTPGVIARIARLLERLPAESYDYRLFM